VLLPVLAGLVRRRRDLGLRFRRQRSDLVFGGWRKHGAIWDGCDSASEFGTVLSTMETFSLAPCLPFRTGCERNGDVSPVDCGRPSQSCGNIGHDDRHEAS
jgi:hypothetical protein